MLALFVRSICTMPKNAVVHYRGIVARSVLNVVLIFLLLVEMRSIKFGRRSRQILLGVRLPDDLLGWMT